MTITTTESETLMADDTFASVWAGCCEHPDDAGAKLIASDIAEELGCENVARGLRFEGGTKWPIYDGWWDTDNMFGEATQLPFTRKAMNDSKCSIFNPLGTPLDHFERLGQFLKEQGCE